MPLLYQRFEPSIYNWKTLGRIIASDGIRYVADMQDDHYSFRVILVEAARDDSSSTVYIAQESEQVTGNRNAYQRTIKFKTGANGCQGFKTWTDL